MSDQASFADGPEVPLLGGDVTEGVVRIGGTVRRPREPHSALVEALLRHLERVGFDGAPRFLGTDSGGRQVLTFVPGEVAGRPWPDWVADDDRAASVTRLVRRYDDAVTGWTVPAEVAVETHPDPPGAPASIDGPPELVGHLDITPENVVFTAGRASALIDFDLAAPTTRVREVANLVLWWAPLLAVADREPAVRDVDPLARTALLLDAYGLGPADRARLVDTCVNGAHRSWFLMRDRAERFGGGWQRMWDAGVGGVIRRRQQWLAEHDTELRAAVG